MRNFINILNESYEPKIDHPNIEYETKYTKGTLSKVIAYLKGIYSGKYTRLANNLLKIQKLKEDITRLQELTKENMKQSVIELFNAEDKIATRVIETNKFIIQITKDPKARETVGYKAILEELETQLTPALLGILQELKAKHTSIGLPSLPSMTVTNKDNKRKFGTRIKRNKISENSELDNNSLNKKVDKFLTIYDRKLDELKSKI